MYITYGYLMLSISLYGKPEVFFLIGEKF